MTCLIGKLLGDRESEPWSPTGTYSISLSGLFYSLITIVSGFYSYKVTSSGATDCLELGADSNGKPSNVSIKFLLPSKMPTTAFFFKFSKNSSLALLYW